jgi:predicted transposase/invertase (TIGR01784 family)
MYRILSAEEEARRVRERALHDETSLLNEARREGFEEGLQKGLQQAIEQGRIETARNLIAMNVLTDEQIAAAAGLPAAAIKALRER